MPMPEAEAWVAIAFVLFISLLIYLGAHNQILSDFATSVRRRLAPFRRAQFRTDGRTSLSHAEHGAVVKAIIACDAPAAHAAMFHHMSLVEDAFGQLETGARASG